MSTIRLLKDHGAGKKGDMISVPFGIGRDYIAAGLGEYPVGGDPLAPPAKAPVIPPGPTPAHLADIRKLQEANVADKQRLVQEFQLELSAVKVDRDKIQEKLNAATAELEHVKPQLHAVIAERDELLRKGSPPKGK